MSELSRAHIVTSWAGDGTEENSFYPDGTEWANSWACQSPAIGYSEIPATSLPNDPSLLVVEVLAPGAVIGDFDDENPGAVIWRNHVEAGIPGPDEVPTPARRGLMINRLRALGVPAPDAAHMVGGNPNDTARAIGRNVAEYAASLRRRRFDPKPQGPMVVILDNGPSVPNAPTVRLLGQDVPLYTTALGKAIAGLFGRKE